MEVTPQSLEKIAYKLGYKDGIEYTLRELKNLGRTYTEDQIREASNEAWYTCYDNFLSPPNLIFIDELIKELNATQP